MPSSSVRFVSRCRCAFRACIVTHHADDQERSVNTTSSNTTTSSNPPRLQHKHHTNTPARSPLASASARSRAASSTGHALPESTLPQLSARHLKARALHTSGHMQTETNPKHCGHLVAPQLLHAVLLRV
eukprot:2631915-Rhodomonas_salina.4